MAVAKDAYAAEGLAVWMVRRIAAGRLPG